jgi:deaminated glutathione amidase
MRVAAIQMVSGVEVQSNLLRAAALVEQAAQAGAQMVCLPEYFCILGHNGYDKVQVAQAAQSGPIPLFLSELAKRHQVIIVGGTLPIVSPQPDKVFNSCLVFDCHGQQLSRYDKIHLFRLNHQGEQFDEAQTIVAGDQPVSFSATVENRAWQVGLTICYDLRFPELFRAISPPGSRCDLILVPSAFTYATGKAHWETLLRARAIENQCYIVAPAQGGQHENGRRTWGHTMVIDPWGKVVACHPEGEGLVLADLSFSTLEQVRTSLPSLTNQQSKNIYENR